MSGSIEVICGPMFSGKTEELIRRLRRADYARQKIMAFKHASDTRYSAGSEYASHAGLRWPCFTAHHVVDIYGKLTDDVKVVGIDEAQFFDAEIIDYVQLLATRGMRVVLAGLDQDFHGNPFGPMPQLLSIAERITKATAVCVICGEPASRTYRTQKSDVLVVVGAAETYEARCRTCHGR